MPRGGKHVKAKRTGRGPGKPWNRNKIKNEIKNEIKKEMCKMVGQVDRDIPLSVSTRGIGFATCGLMHRINPYPQINPPSIYAIYRAGLGILEAKVCHNRSNIKNPPGSRPAHPLENQFFQSALTEGDFTLPEPLFSVIFSVGIARAKGKKYGPVLSPDKYLELDDTPIIIPNPCNVLLTNLRETVMALADPLLPQAERDEFIAHNPIPGCRFIAGMLDNPDDIIPKNYGYNDLCRDVNDLKSLCWQMKGVVPHYKPASIKLDAKGTRAMLLCNSMGTMRCRDLPKGCTDEDYRKNCNPEGNITEFWSGIHIKNKLVYEGINALLGELPSNSQACNPLHQSRLRETNEHTYNLNYKDALLFSMNRWSFSAQQVSCSPLKGGEQ